MFYDRQPVEQREKYKRLLGIMGSLSKLFSESSSPYLPYRAHENLFSYCFEAKNLAREDCSADAVKEAVGVGLKTWVGADNQKIAEFNSLKSEYSNLEGLELVKKIASYRNDRIGFTMRAHGLSELVYHVIKRTPHKMTVLECPIDTIDIDRVEVFSDRSRETNIYFSDGKHTYHFNVSKSTLYMIFDNLVKLDDFGVMILDNPISFLQSGADAEIPAGLELGSISCGNAKPILCLPLYSKTRNRGKYVPTKSGLNQWNAGGRKRDPNEVYIPYNKEDRERIPGFFPDRYDSFTLRLPDGKAMIATVCQADGKAIMSNPNLELGKWLLRDVFNLPENTIVTYSMLMRYGIDCVIFTKNKEHDYSIDFGYIGTYEKYYSETAKSENQETEDGEIGEES